MLFATNPKTEKGDVQIMKKVFFAILALSLSAACASAQVAWNSYNLNQTINLKAQINQTATLSCPGSVFFDVKDATVATNGDASVNCTAKVSLHKGGSASYTVSNSTLTGTESGNVIPDNFVWVKTNLSLAFGPMDGGYYPLSYGPPSGATLNHDMNLVFSFQLQPVPTFVPDIYAGTATITLQVI
jgi:hypothetical protein